jgi:hypothetical protein
MKKAWIWLMVFGVVAIFAFLAIFLIVRYWDKITEYADSGKDKADKIVQKVKRSKKEYEPGEYLEI